MRFRTLGDGSLRVSELGLGCMGLGAQTYGHVEESDAVAIVRRAIELGVTLFDTADVYGPHRSERLLGKAIEGSRDELTICSKVGIVMPDGSSDLVPKGASMGVDGTPDHIRRSCDASLTRLGTDWIDVYYLHRVDPSVPIDESVGALGGLVAAGKVRHVGISEAKPDEIRRAYAAHPVSVLQEEYSLWTRNIESEVLPLARELSIGIVAYSPLGRGFLTGTIKSAAGLSEDDYRRINPRFTGDNLQTNLDLVSAVEDVAARTSATPGQVALAWVLSQGRDIVAIPGATEIGHVSENAGASGLELPEEEIEWLEMTFTPDAAAGQRYPTDHMP